MCVSACISLYNLCIVVYITNAINNNCIELRYVLTSNY